MKKNNHWINRMAIGDKNSVLSDFGLISPLFNLSLNIAWIGYLPNAVESIYLSSEPQLLTIKLNHINIYK